MKSFKFLIIFLLHIFFVSFDIACSYTSRLVVSSKAISNVFGFGRFYKAVVFNDNVTISDAHALTLGVQDELEVLGQTTDKVTITAESTIAGISAAKEAELANRLTLSPNTAAHGKVSIDGNVVINGNLTVGTVSGGNFEVDGDLVVTGQVSVIAGSMLVVKGDIVFDGNGASRVTIAGTVSAQGIRHADGSQVSQGSIVIRNAVGSGNNSVSITNTITATDSITLDNNTGGNGIAISGMMNATYGDIVIQNNTATGADAVNITSTVTAYNDIIIADNSTSGATFDGVQLASTVQATNGNIVLRGNSGATSGHGVHIATGTTSARGTIALISNTGASGNGVHIAGTLSAALDVLIRGNMSSSANVNVVGVLQSAQNIVFDEAVIVSGTGSLVNSGSILGDVVIQGDFTLLSSLQNVFGNLTTLGGTVTTATTLSIEGDVMLDGQGTQAFTLFQQGTNMTANNIMIKNFDDVVLGAACNFEPNTTVTVRNNLILQNMIGKNDDGVIINGTVTAVGGNIVFCRCASESPGGVGLDGIDAANCTIRARNGTILFRECYGSALSTGGIGVCLQSTTTIEAKNIFFVDNYAQLNNVNGVLIAANMTAHRDLLFARNYTASGGSAFGVELGATTQTCHNLFLIHNTTNTPQQEIDDSGTTFTQYYGGGALAAANRFEKTDAVFDSM